MKFFSRWFKHAMLNLGVVLEAAWYGILPPQVSHTRSECEGFDVASAWDWFKWGAGITVGRLRCDDDSDNGGES